jgi:hypothetical protein
MPQAEAIAIDNTARIYSCSRCHVQTVICRCCDRGNVYCPECALPARQEARRRASTRYQKSSHGRLNHAARQRRYRERLSEKVTHNGSLEAGNSVRHSTKGNSSISRDLVTAEIIVCHFCYEICSPFLRIDYLLRPGRTGNQHLKRMTSERQRNLVGCRDVLVHRPSKYRNRPIFQAEQRQITALLHRR